MLGDTIDIKKDERRYNQLLGEGFLPSAAIRKIENEKRLGIGVDTSGGIGDLDINIVKVATIGLALVVGFSILKGKTSSSSSSKTLAMKVKSVDDIVGIDLVALNVCRQNGLM